MIINASIKLHFSHVLSAHWPILVEVKSRIKIPLLRLWESVMSLWKENIESSFRCIVLNVVFYCWVKKNPEMMLTTNVTHGTEKECEDIGLRASLFVCGCRCLCWFKVTSCFVFFFFLRLVHPRSRAAGQNETTNWTVSVEPLPLLHSLKGLY